jgi:hypothetical protein
MASPGRAYVSSSLEAPALLLKDDRVLDPGLGQDEVLTAGRLLVGRDPPVDQVRHRGPVPHGGTEERSLSVVKPCHHSPSDLIGSAPPRRPGMSGFIGRARHLSSNDRLPTGTGGDASGSRGIPGLHAGPNNDLAERQDGMERVLFALARQQQPINPAGQYS